GDSYPEALGSGDWVHAVGIVVFLFVVPLLVALLLWLARNARGLVKAGPGDSGRASPLVQPLLLVGVQLLLASGIFTGLIALPWQRSWSAGWITVLLAAVYATVLG